MEVEATFNPSHVVFLREWEGEGSVEEARKSEGISTALRGLWRIGERLEVKKLFRKVSTYLMLSYLTITLIRQRKSRPFPKYATETELVREIHHLPMDDEEEGDS